MKIGILNEFLGLEQNYINACKDMGIKFELVDIISSDWILPTIWNGLTTNMGRRLSA